MEKKSTVLVINPGSTSTKIAVFVDESELFRQNIEHSNDDLAVFSRIVDQYDLRKQAILASLTKNGVEIDSLSAIVARGGTLPPLSGGAYRINEAMVAYLKSDQIPEHASNVAALIAYDIAQPLGITSIIYDAVSTDELEPIARISGMPAIARQSLSHALNSRAMARKAAVSLNKNYQELNIIVAHLGGGVTVSLHKKGRLIDLVSDDEGSFSPERAGRVPCRQLIDLCYSGKYDYNTMRRMLRGKGGLSAYLGTNSGIEVEKMIEDGSKEALLIYQALAYQVAKAIGELATVVQGKVDFIILTGGMAHSKLLADWIGESVRFIAPVQMLPGENELESLAFGGLRVLHSQEVCQEFAIK